MESNKTIATIIGLAIALIIMGILLPLGLNDLTGYDGTYNSSYVSGTQTLYNAGTNSTMATLVGTIIPIMMVIGIVLGIVNMMNKNRGED